MPRYECQACHGTFQSPLDDGLEYYHVCPPLSPDEIMHLVGQGALQADPTMAADITAAQVAHDPTAPVPDAVLAARERLAGRRLVRPGHVNQNVVRPAKPLEPKEKADIQAAGAGVRKLEVVA